ncbi:MAG: hypothetical protein ABI169_08045 [Chitinophagaceae bacterium]
MNIKFQISKAIPGREKFSAPYTAIIAEELVPFAAWIDQVDSNIFSGKAPDELCCTLSVKTGNLEKYSVSSSSATYEDALFTALTKLKEVLTKSVLPKKPKASIRSVLLSLGL